MLDDYISVLSLYFTLSHSGVLSLCFVFLCRSSSTEMSAVAFLGQSPAGPNVRIEPTASDITSPQDDLAAVEQSSAGQTQLVTSCIPGKSLYDLVIIPNRSSRRDTKRKKMTSFNITSEEHLEFIAVKEGKKGKRQWKSGKAVGLAVRPTEEVQQDLLKQKEVAGGKSKTKARSAPKQKSASRKNCQEAETVCRQL